MDEQSEIERLFSKLSEYTAIRYRLFPFYSAFQRWTVLIAMSAIFLALFIALFAKPFGLPSATIRLVGLILALLAQLSGMVLMIASAFESIKFIVQPARSLLRDRASKTQRDFDFA